ncbi:O-methylsterigmatocystin oxidoreductase [Coprinopsis sp. MPI-PUGE-AT-0042]|nr:O-methylsterigmatocystin oxidoreductase [Coprinopsis sp. MPI-PUGE-AT-0042]
MWGVYSTISTPPSGFRFAALSLRRNYKGLPLPPGPKRVPIFGNMFQLSSSGKPWVAYRDWGEVYGDMVYFEVMGSPVLVLNSLDTCRELFEKRAPQLLGPQDACSIGYVRLIWNFGLLNYGPQLRSNRRVFHSYFNQNEVPTYHPVIERRTLAFLRAIGSRPQDLCNSVKYLFGSTIMEISYGANDPKYTESLIDDAEAIADGFGEVSIPGRFLVDVFPHLRYIPSWFPWTGWKRRLGAIGAKSRNVYHHTFNDAKERVKQGLQNEDCSAAGSLIGKMLTKEDPEHPIQEELNRNTILIAYIGMSKRLSQLNQPSLVSTSAGKALFLALAMRPEVQNTAQKELDTVIGRCRLPKPYDISKLPYIRAIVKEGNRWHSVTPLAIPHVVKDDDEYNGYFIPRGTTVFGAITHDPEVYEDPMEFKPERFMNIDSSAMDPDIAVFGVGRRICPGRHLSNVTLPYMVTCVLSVYDIKPAKDARGNEIPLVYDTSTDIIPKPSPFQCGIVPRSAQHAALLSEA